MMCLRWTQHRAPFRSWGSFPPCLAIFVRPHRLVRLAVVVGVFAMTASSPGAPIDMLRVEREALSSAPPISVVVNTCVRGPPMAMDMLFLADGALGRLVGELFLRGVPSGEAGASPVADAVADAAADAAAEATARVDLAICVTESERDADVEDADAAAAARTDCAVCFAFGCGASVVAAAAAAAVEATARVDLAICVVEFGRDADVADASAAAAARTDCAVCFGFGCGLAAAVRDADDAAAATGVDCAVEFFLRAGCFLLPVDGPLRLRDMFAFFGVDLLLSGRDAAAAGESGAWTEAGAITGAGMPSEMLGDNGVSERWNGQNYGRCAPLRTDPKTQKLR